MLLYARGNRLLAHFNETVNQLEVMLREVQALGFSIVSPEAGRLARPNIRASRT
jgi:hypothetical protein